jgi:translation initiation factor IF-2
MSDQNPSDVAPQADAVTSSVPAAPVAFDGFGSSRGTGLARGKRPARPTQTATGSESVSGYQPTSIQIVVAPTTYQNPFDAELAPAPQPAAPAPLVESVAAPAPVSAPVNPVAPVFAQVAFAAPAEVPAAVVPAAVAVPEPARVAPVAVSVPEAKAELNILPPAAPRPATSWESSGSPSADVAAPRKTTPTGEDRTVFKIERNSVATREITPLDPSFKPAARSDQPRGDRPRRDERRRDEGRASEQPAKPRVSAYPYNGDRTPSAAKPAAKSHTKTDAPASGGFVSWLKGIFGGSSAEASAPKSAKPSERAERSVQGQGQGQGEPRRRRRGGRGRSGGPGAGPDTRGPRPEGQGQPQQGQRRREGGPGGDRGQGRGPRPDGPAGGAPRPPAAG